MWPFDMADKIHEIRKSGNLYFLLNSFIGSVNRLADAIGKGGSGGNNEVVLLAINNLDRKVTTFMATQEERLRGIQGQLTSIADGINTLQQQVADLKANNPELDDEITAIEGTIQTIKDDLNPPAPPAEGGGEVV